MDHDPDFNHISSAAIILRIRKNADQYNMLAPEHQPYDDTCTFTISYSSSLDMCTHTLMHK